MLNKPMYVKTKFFSYHWPAPSSLALVYNDSTNIKLKTWIPFKSQFLLRMRPPLASILTGEDKYDQMLLDWVLAELR